VHPPTNLIHSTGLHRTTQLPHEIARQGITLHSTALGRGAQAGRAGNTTAVPSLDQPNPTHLATRPPREETTQSGTTRPDITQHKTAFPPSAQSSPMSLQATTPHDNAVLRFARLTGPITGRGRRRHLPIPLRRGRPNPFHDHGPSPITHDPRPIRESAFPRATRLNSPPTRHGATRPRLPRPTLLLSHRGTLRHHWASHPPHGRAFRPRPHLLHPTTPSDIPAHATIPHLFHPSSPDHFPRVHQLRSAHLNTAQHSTAQDATGIGRMGRDTPIRPLAQHLPPPDTTPRRAARHHTAVLFLPP
jgi:hypothetical protein